MLAKDFQRSLNALNEMHLLPILEGNLDLAVAGLAVDGTGAPFEPLSRPFHNALEQRLMPSLGHSQTCALILKVSNQAMTSEWIPIGLANASVRANPKTQRIIRIATMLWW